MELDRYEGSQWGCAAGFNADEAKLLAASDPRDRIPTTGDRFHLVRKVVASLDMAPRVAFASAGHAPEREGAVANIGLGICG